MLGIRGISPGGGSQNRNPLPAPRVVHDPPSWTLRRASGFLTRRVPCSTNTIARAVMGCSSSIAGDLASSPFCFPRPHWASEGDGVVRSTWTVLRPAMPSRRHPLRTFVQSNQASSFDSARISGRSSVIRTGPPFFRWAGLSFRWQIQMGLSSVDRAVDLLGCSKEGTNSSWSQTFPLIRIHLEFTRFVHNC